MLLKRVKCIVVFLYCTS